MQLNHWNTLKICYLAELLSNRQAILNPENLENTSNFEGWGKTLCVFKKKVYFVNETIELYLKSKV